MHLIFINTRLLVAEQVCSHFIDGKWQKEKDITGPEEYRQSVANTLLKLKGSSFHFISLFFLN